MTAFIKVLFAVAIYSVGIGATFEHEARTASDFDMKLPPIYVGAIFWPLYWPAQVGRYVMDHLP